MDSEYLISLFDIRDRVIVITGGGGVLCGTIARALSRLGARIAILDISATAAQTMADDITAQGGTAIAVPTDVLSREQVEAALVRVQEALGPVDVLINGAGGNHKNATTGPDLSFFDLPQAAFESVFDLNFLGTLVPSQVFGGAMVERGEGCILNIASICALRAMTKIPAYAAAKAAVKSFTEWLAVHISQNYSPRIRVNALAPGFFLTNQNRYLLLDEATGGYTARGQAICNHTPMGRCGDPQELIAAVLWLISPGASFVHGATITVDGGFTAFGGV
ncbi:MAG: SDR family oxidoreductase [Anaerolineae bacterium]|jgi:NAD(P)-dependent dehydrogenase (short-subunit alcohol dehydrogenase family)